MSAQITDFDKVFVLLKYVLKNSPSRNFYSLIIMQCVGENFPSNDRGRYFLNNARNYEKRGFEFQPYLISNVPSA